jgi:hypothetical protein
VALELETLGQPFFGSDDKSPPAISGSFIENIDLGMT